MQTISILKQRWPKALAAVLVAALVLIGCEADPRQSYVEPKLADSQTAKLTGGFGYYVTEVDGDRVDSGNITLSTFGGNSLKLQTGQHDLRFHWEDPNGRHSRSWFVRYTFEAGHAYRFGMYSLFDTALTITDEQTKEQKTFDPEDSLEPTDE